MALLMVTTSKETYSKVKKRISVARDGQVKMAKLDLDEPILGLSTSSQQSPTRLLYRHG
jgi:hypothetical protein